MLSQGRTLSLSASPAASEILSVYQLHNFLCHQFPLFVCGDVVVQVEQMYIELV